MVSHYSQRDCAAMDALKAGRNVGQVTGVARAERSMLYEHDTGLVSKDVFRDRSQHALATSRRRDRRVALVVLEIDPLDPVTATIAEGLLRQLRREDTVAVLDDSYIGILVEDVPGAVVAQRIRQRLAGALESCRASSVAVSDSRGRIGFWLDAAVT